jgi:ATP-binding cassette subfamily B protein
VTIKPARAGLFLDARGCEEEAVGIRTLWDLTGGQRARYACAIAAMAVSYVFLSAVTLVIGAALDRIRAGGAADTLWIDAALVVGLTAAGCAFAYLRLRWVAVAAETTARSVRDRIYGHLENLPCAYHDRADTGDLVQRCTSDVETVRVFLSQQLVEISRTALLLLIVVPILLWLDATLALVSVALFPVIFLFAAVFFRRVKALFQRVDEAEGAMTSVLQENLTGIRVVRAFARQEFECAKFDGRNRHHRDLHFRLFRLLGNYWALSDLLCLAQLGLVLIVGGHRLLGGTISVGTLYEFVTYVGVVVWPVRHLGRVLQDTGKAIVSLRRLREILAVAEEAGGGLVPSGPLRGAIEVGGLSFSHGGAPVLREIAFSVAPGQTLALLGPPGSGKSTLVQILLRLYSYTEGSFRLDGHELRDLDPRYVRAQVGVVMQEPFLYSRTIGANVRLGRSAATHDEIVASATAASIHGTIEEFEEGYETLVGERGVTLSGGQRQRVALARALLKDAPILVLDDALSAVDTETETRILEALRARRGRHTTIVIAHRLSSVAHADRILVLERGAIVQAGTHRELLEREGPYRRLWRLQEEELDEVRL